MLPDVALLKIFDFYEDEQDIEAWHTLVHVCREWRSIVFGSPRRLSLRLYCKARTPVRETLDVWPLLPIVVRSDGYETWGVEGIIAALKHNDRISELGLVDIPSSQLETIWAAMEQSFPELTHLQLQRRDDTAPVVPASFLGGSLPRLQSLFLYWIPFPGLPKLLMSTIHLVRLDLRRIPHSGYISPEVMANCLSVLTRLETFVIKFESPPCSPNHTIRRSPPRTCILLPVLKKFLFFGVSEYLEDLVGRIDAPLLNNLDITFLHQLIFSTPQITQFISRTPNFKAHDRAQVFFSDWGVLITLPQTVDGKLSLGISCKQSDWQLSSLAQICSSSFPQALISAVEHLYILEDTFPRLHWQDDTAGSQWLEFLRPFITVKGLYISREFVPRVATALQELVGGNVTEVLPALQTLFSEGSLPSGSVQELIEQFVAVRQLSSHPIAISHWERGLFED